MSMEGFELWFKRLDEYLEVGTPIYGRTGFISIKMMHGGEFENNQGNYTGNGVGYFDFVSAERIKLFDLKEMAKVLGGNYDVDTIFFYQKKYDGGVFQGYRGINTDQDVLDISKFVNQMEEREAEIYIVDSVGTRTSKITRKDKGKQKMVVEEPIEEVNMSDDDTETECESFNDSEYDSAADDYEYDAYVDVGLEYEGVSVSSKNKGKAKMSCKKKIEWSPGVGQPQKMDGIDYDSEGGIEDYESPNETQRPKGRVFNPKIDLEEPKFELLMQFRDVKQFGEAVKRHAIKEGRSITFPFRKRDKAKAVCKHPCQWNCYVSKDQNERNLIVKTLNSEHTCARGYKSKYTSSAWLAQVCLDAWKKNPNKTAVAIKNMIWEKYAMNISKHQVYRAKEKAFKIINGGVEEQYERMWDYGEELRRRNPGSTVLMKLVDDSVREGMPRFQRFYVCLEGLKRGFKYCRPCLSVDGCFLKGVYGGQLLSASGIDPNNNWFPVAYAVVESENKDSWSWFMSLLAEDLDIDDVGFTIMSDKQKGLIETVKQLLPSAEHRFCVMHMLGNMRSAGYKGITYKEFLWNAARATTVSRFQHWMEKIAEHDINAFHWFDDKPPENWSRSAFNTSVKCDILLNNLSESFNSHILEARHKPIISCLEAIRKMLMVRLETNRQTAANKWYGRLCPKIFKELEKRKKRVNECIPLSSGGQKFEVSCMYGPQYSVNLADKSCTCRKWDLSGIPCCHAIACLYVIDEDPEMWVDECYTVVTYRRVYGFLINPMDGMSMWPSSGYPGVHPPIVKKKAGRPKKMRRKGLFDREIDREENEGVQVQISEALEDGSSRVKRRVMQRSLKCSVCKIEGHNKRSCPVLKDVEAAENTILRQQSSVQHTSRPKLQAVRRSFTAPPTDAPPPVDQDVVDAFTQPPPDSSNDDNNASSQVSLSPFKQNNPFMFNGNRVISKSDYALQMQQTSEPPYGVMKMVVPPGRAKHSNSQSFKSVELSSPTTGPAIEPQSGFRPGVFERGGKTYITLKNLKGTLGKDGDGSQSSQARNVPRTE